VPSVISTNGVLADAAARLAVDGVMVVLLAGEVRFVV
jgi:hypothetical protein